MKWTVHGERVIYDSPWVRLALTDIEVPGGPRFEHHVVRATAHASGVVVDAADRGVLLLWRHRFTTDTWGWEIPAGRIDQGESPVDAGARETLEESGWRPGPLTHLTTYFPNNGQSDTAFHLFRATTAEHVGEPTDLTEAARVEWLAWPEVRDEIRAGHIGDGLSLTALLWVMALGDR